MATPLAGMADCENPLNGRARRLAVSVKLFNSYRMEDEMMGCL